MCVFWHSQTCSTQYSSSNKNSIVINFMYIQVSRHVNFTISVTYFHEFYNTKFWINNDADSVDCVSFSISARFTMKVSHYILFHYIRQYNLIAFIITKDHFHKGYRSYVDADIQVFTSGSDQDKSLSQGTWYNRISNMRCTIKISQL